MGDGVGRLRELELFVIEEQSWKGRACLKQKGQHHAGVIRLLEFAVVHACQTQTLSVIPQITYLTLYPRLVGPDSSLAGSTRIFRLTGARIIFHITAE